MDVKSCGTFTHWNTAWQEKEGNLPFSTARMDLESVTLSEISQSEKDEYYMISLYMWNLKNKTKKQSRNRLIDTENRLAAVKSVQGWVEKVTGLRKNTLETCNSILVTRGSEGQREVEEGKGGINDDGKR